MDLVPHEIQHAAATTGVALFDDSGSHQGWPALQVCGADGPAIIAELSEFSPVSPNAQRQANSPAPCTPRCCDHSAVTGWNGCATRNRPPI